MKSYGGNGMLDVSLSHCSRFSRRNDLNVFNMSDYMSCENCRHNTADDQCLAKMMPPSRSFPVSFQ